MKTVLGKPLANALVAVAAVGLFTLDAQASLLLYDGFGTSAAPAPAGDYTAEASVADQGHGTGWTGNWTLTGTATTELNSLSVTGLLDDPGHLLTATGGVTLVRSFSSTDFSNLGSEIWFSFVFERASGTNNFSFRIADSSTRYFGISLPNSPNEMRADLRYSGSTVESSSASVAITNGTTYHIIGRMVVTDGNDRLDVWVNPGDFSSVANLGASTMFVETANNYTTFDEIRIANGSNASYRFDEIRVGNTLADVAPVPEPASLGLIAASAGLLLARRRRA